MVYKISVFLINFSGLHSLDCFRIAVYASLCNLSSMQEGGVFPYSQTTIWLLMSVVRSILHLSSYLMVATNILNMMQERTVATDSLACLAQMLKRSRPLLQCMLAQESLAAVEFFYTRSVCMRSQTIVASSLLVTVHLQ